MTTNRQIKVINFEFNLQVRQKTKIRHQPISEYIIEKRILPLKVG